jgi:molybdopterin/thiamine biosynthesis adenylyltransferase
MNFDRIRPSIDVDRMQQSHVTVVGGAYGLTQDLVRCGLGSVTYVDFDRVDASNPTRQDFNLTDLGQHKVEALAASVKRINPDVEMNCLVRDFCDIGQEEFDANFGHTDLLIFATDFFPAQARGNLQALRLRKPAIWIGLYREGRAGEIVHWYPGVTPACYRCVCSSRYGAFAAQASGAGNTVHVPSTGGTIFDLHLVDAIAGQIAVGILTAGADNRLGRLIQKLGNRNFLQVKIDPDYRLGDRDVFAEYLGNHPANFSFSTIALPMEPERNCPDCAKRRREERAA